MEGFTHRRLKFLQLVVVIATGLIGLTSVVLLSKVNSHFQDHCPLYAELQVKRTRVSGDVIVKVNIESTWGEPETCNFATFEGLVVFVACFVWFWFYLHMSVLSHDSTSQEAIFVMPRIIINCLLCLVSFIRAGYVTSGYTAFCDDISICTTAGPQRKDLCRHSDGACNALQTNLWDVVTTQKKAVIFHYDDAMHTAIALSWLEPVALALNVTVVIVEIYLLTNFNGNETARSSNKAFCFDSVTGSHTALWINDSKGDAEESDDSELSAASDSKPGSQSSSGESLCGDTAHPNAALSGQAKTASLEKSPPPVPRLWAESVGAEPGEFAQWSGTLQPSGQSEQVDVGPDDFVVNPQPRVTDPAVIISPVTSISPTRHSQNSGKPERV